MATGKSTARTVVVKFILDGPKKHSVLYREVSADPMKQVLRSLYIANAAVLELGSPKTVEVTITAVE